jgi:hypothetical protein
MAIDKRQKDSLLEFYGFNMAFGFLKIIIIKVPFSKINS